MLKYGKRCLFLNRLIKLHLYLWWFEKYCPQGLICLNAWPIARVTMKRQGLPGVGVALLKVVCHCGCTLMVSKPQWSPAWDTHHFLLPVDQDVEFSAISPAACLIACCHEDNEINIWNYKLAPNKYFILLELLLSRCLFTTIETITKIKP